MTIEFKFSGQDIETLNKERADCGLPDVSLDQLLDGANGFLAEMGINNATVSLITTPNGQVYYGRERVPLLVSHKSGRFVIKPYKHSDPGREKRIINIVSGLIAPNVIRFGKDHYAELFVDPTLYATLATIADQRVIHHDDQPLHHALFVGGEMHAALYHMNIAYHHLHWLDEFNLHRTEMRPLITDFGHAMLVNDETFHRYKGLMGNNDAKTFHERYYREVFGDIPYTIPYDFFLSMVKLVKDLTKDPSEMVSLLDVLSTGFIGIQLYLESDYKEWLPQKAKELALETTQKLFPIFEDSFASEYRQRNLLRSIRVRNYNGKEEPWETPSLRCLGHIGEQDLDQLCPMLAPSRGASRLRITY